MIISHRGNLSGRDPALENTEGAILKAISMGYDVEVDIRKIGDKFFLGHDTADREVSIGFLLKHSSHLWIHSKNVDALCYFVEHEFNTFYHTDEDYVLTSKGIIWAYPGNELQATNLGGMISVLPDVEDHRYMFILKMRKCLGICTDYPTSL